MRRGGGLAITAIVVTLGACQRAPHVSDDFVAVWISPREVDRYEAAAKKCGAQRTRLIEDDRSRLFVVERDESVETRRCFAAVVEAEYERRHPFRSRLMALVE